MKWGPIQALGVINIVLAATLASIWVDQQGQLRNTRWAAPVAVLPDFSRPAAGGDASKLAANPINYLEILERPMFAPDRRPPPPPAPPPPPDPMADVRISAIFTGEYAGVFARVEGRMLRVKVGEGIGAWTLQSVEGRKASFVSGDQTREVELAYSKLGVPMQVASSGANATTTATGAPNPQDEARERLRRRNEIRASRGLPPVTD